MATYTSNLNLYMPDSTDDFGEFREEHNDNMVKIDNAIGGGGGSGGHTIVNENGTDMPAEGKLQFTGGVAVTDDSVNGKTVVDISGGGGNVYGAFIDTNRIITSGTYSGTFSYTATEDCAFRFVVSGTSSSSGKVFLDNVIIQSVYVPNNNDYQDVVFIKKGQTVRVESQQGGTWNYTVYGLTQGTNGIFTPIIYSDTERVVGVWRDNKPLYTRTFALPSPINISPSSWDSMGVSVADGENVIFCWGIATDGTGSPLMGYFSSNVLMCQTPRNNNPSYSIQYLIVQYTKTTDVAGSGNWNTDGVPTVHYSTTEQVIGTYLGKPLYQISVSLTSGIAIGSYGHISLPADSIVRRFDGYAYRNSHASVDKFNGFINSGDLYASIRNGDIEYWISNIFNPVEEIEFTVQYTKVTD